MNHFQRLMRLYEKAPIHEFYRDISILVEHEKATITLPVDRRYFHGGMAMHGSVYFKLLDDASYFACLSTIEDFFIVTTNFNISLRRPVTSGKIRAVGTFDSASDTIFYGSAILYDELGKICATGKGEFMKSKTRLGDLVDYA